jgi:purine-binding chemotaxis protein CheW
MHSVDEKKVLVFKLASHEHAVEVSQVQEILGALQITRVLEAPDFVEGVINLRGRIVPVVDLRKRLNLPAVAKTSETCIIVVTLANQMVGFEVDSASELLAFPLERMEAPTEMVAGINTRFLEGVVYCDDRLLVILNLREILSLPERQQLEQEHFELADVQPAAAGRDHIEGQGDTPGPTGASEETSASRVRKIIAFGLDDEVYGLDIGDVAESLEMVPIRPLPHVPDFILGMINLRGNLVPLLDLRTRFGLNRMDGEHDSRILVIKDQKQLVGIVADRIIGLLRLDAAEFQPPPPGVAKVDAEFFKEVSQFDGQLLIIPDIKKILADTANRN